MPIIFDFTQVFSIFREMLPKNSFLLVCLLFSITGLIDEVCCDIWDLLPTEPPLTTLKPSTTIANECETNSYPITVDITQTFVQTINQVLENIISKLKHEGISYHSESTTETSISLNPKGINGLVSFSNISVVNYVESWPESLTCEFAEYLKIRIPLKDEKLVFRGRVYIHKNPSLKYETGEFHVTFNQLVFSITKKSDSNVETDINYKNFNIELEVDHKDESAVLGMIDELIQTLVLYMKTSLNERSEDRTPRWYAYNILSLQELFDTCMNPESNISRSYPDFTSSREKYYYVINSQHSDSIGSVNLRINKIALNGLSNFKSIESYNYDSDHYNRRDSFTLLIENINGYAEWQYYDNSNEFSKQSNILKFKIDDIHFPYKSGIKYGLSLTCMQSNDSISSFAKTILTEQLKMIIEPNLRELFSASSRRYSYYYYG